MNGGRDLLVHGWLKLILDGSSLGNSDITESGGVIRNDVGNWVQGVFKNIYSVKMVFAMGHVVNSKNKV